MSESTRAAVALRVAELLREARVKRGLSMSVVAERASLSQQMVSYVERSLRSPTLATLLRLAEALKINISDLLAEAERTSQDQSTAVRVASKKVGAAVDRLAGRRHGRRD